MELLRRYRYGLLGCFLFCICICIFSLIAFNLEFNHKQQVFANVNRSKADFSWGLLLSFILFSALFWFTYLSLWSKRKQRKSSELKLDSIFNKSQSFVGLLSTDGTLLELNDTALSFGGFSREEATGMKLWETPLWSLNIKSRQYLESAIKKASEGASVRYDVEVVGGEGQRIILDFSLEPVRNKKGEIIYIIPEGRNITEKVSLQKEIEENNQSYRAIQKLSNIGIWSVDLKTNKLKWDATVYDIHELEEGTEISIDDAINFYREDFQKLIRDSLKDAIKRKEIWDFEAILITHKKTEVWVRAIGYPVFRNDELTELRGTITNIDSWKRNEEKLAEKENRLRLAMDATKLGMWDWDLVQDVLTWDATMYELYGVNPSDFSGAYEAWTSAVHPDDLKRALEKVNESIDNRKSLHMNFRIITKSGIVRYLKADASIITDDTGVPIRMIGINKDITESIENETKIHELNANLEDMVAERTAELNAIKVELEQQLGLLGVSAMVSEMSLSGEILSANDSFHALCGYSKDELIGQKYSLLKSGIQNEKIFVDMWETISNGGTWQGELCNLKKSGELYWVHATIQPFLDEENCITRYVGVYFDITQLKESTHKLSEMNAELDAANRELETFSYSVSHDLKAPLRALHGFSKNVLERYESSLDDTGKRWLHFIQDNAQRMDGLISDILSYSKIGKATIRKTNYKMKALVEEKINAIEKGYLNNTKVVLSDDLPDVSSDKTMIGVIWQNLIDNAFKYSQKTENSQIAIWGERNGKGVNYYVKDNGSGFDMRHYDKLFGIFQRLHSQQEFEGTGVGLANVQRIIAKHNGTISASGETNKGATFHFFLPYDNQEHMNIEESTP